TFKMMHLVLDQFVNKPDNSAYRSKTEKNPTLTSFTRRHGFFNPLYDYTQIVSFFQSFDGSPMGTWATESGGSRSTLMLLNRFSSFSPPSASPYTRASAAIPAKSTMQYLKMYSI
ncbi:2-aminoethylphosphonate--pyruvate transaminase, partial [Striga asiatica]